MILKYLPLMFSFRCSIPSGLWNVDVIRYHRYGDGLWISHPGDYSEEDQLGTTGLVHIIAFSGIVQDPMLFRYVQYF